MRGKIFSIDEANRMLPLVSRIADDIVTAYQEVNRTLQAFEMAKAAAEQPGAQDDPLRQAALAERDSEVATVLDRFQSLVEEVEALGGTVKDYERGFVDFYGEVEGEIVYLCWQRGEDHIGFWHRLEDGFAKRRPIPCLHAA
jgi:hypothetical protein